MPPRSRVVEFHQRVIACFKALAAGDAIGKQTETLSHADVRKWYPGGITGFEGTPGDMIPRYRGKRYEWKIAETTDDTEQTLAVARAILRDGSVRHESIGRELLGCRKSVHPGVSMWPFVQAGDASRTADSGDGCGAAMRVSPVGVLYPSSDLDGIVRAAYESAMPTHGGQSAICAAAAVAAAISAAADGHRKDDVFRIALNAARRAESLKPQSRPVTIADSIEKIHADLSGHTPVNIDYIAAEYFPDRPETIVPLAISLALVTESAEATILLSANIGGDTDSVASIGGAIAAALRPATGREDWFHAVSTVEPLPMIDVAVSLAALRRTP